MDEWILKYWLEVAFGLSCSLTVALIRYVLALRLGVQALLRDRIVQAYYHYDERGGITLHGLEAVNSMYTEYHNLGGNGTVTKLVEDLRCLDVVGK